MALIKKIFILALVVLSLVKGNSQNVDSLKTILHQVTGESKIEVSFKLANILKEVDIQESIFYGQLALELAQELQSEYWIAESNNALGISYGHQGKYELSFQYFTNAIKSLENQQIDSFLQLKILSNLGITSSKLYQFDQALEYLYKGLSMAKEMNDEKNIVQVLDNIAYNYFDLEDFDNSLYYFLKALKLKNENGFVDILSGSYASIANIYGCIDEYDKALSYLDSALIVVDTTQLNVELAYVYTIKGELHTKINEYSLARKYLNKVLKIGIDHNNDVIKIKVWRLYGKLAKEQGFFKEAEIYLKRVLEKDTSSLDAGLTAIDYGDILQELDKEKSNYYYQLAHSIGEKISSYTLKSKAYKKLSNLAYEQGFLEQAFQYLKLYKSSSDSLTKRQNLRSVHALNIRFEVKQKELKIVQLEKEKKLQEQFHYVRKQRLYLILLLIGVSLFLFSSWLYRKWEFRKKLLQEKNLRESFYEEEKKKNIEKMIMQSRELTTQSMIAYERSEHINKAVQQLNTYKKFLKPEIRNSYSKVLYSLKNQENQNSWAAFEKYFNETHEGFYKKLHQNFPNLTPSERKLCAFLRLKLNSKEIANLLHISPNSVQVSRSRLRKKLKLERNISLVDFLSSI